MKRAGRTTMKHRKANGENAHSPPTPPQADSAPSGVYTPTRIARPPLRPAHPRQRRPPFLLRAPAAAGARAGRGGVIGVGGVGGGAVAVRGIRVRRGRRRRRHGEMGLRARRRAWASGAAVRAGRAPRRRAVHVFVLRRALRGFLQREELRGAGRTALGPADALPLALLVLP
ncbi:hypothetical protein C8R44DRAFT_750301 [Mycena epipterygia]|nr:hypothetical protein C8R44DRAFT_750301 [Mycena epipterygia]